MSFAASTRLGLRPLAQQTRFSRPARRLSSSSASAASSLVSSAMGTSGLVAAAAVAAGAYVLYTRTSSVAHAETAAGAAKPPFAGFGFRTLRLAETTQVSHNVKHLRFDLGDPDVPSGLSVTSTLLAIAFPGGRWLPVLRPYTPINDIDDRGHVDLLVKQYPNGKQSSHLHSLRPGDAVTFVRIPGYRWTPNAQRHVALVAGGQGITPCYQLLRGILGNARDATRVTLVWGVNSEADLVLRDELAALQQQHPGRLATRYVVSTPTDAGGPGGQGGFATGRVTAALLKEAGVVADNGIGKVFVSGPPAMEQALLARDGALAALGFGKKEVHKF